MRKLRFDMEYNGLEDLERVRELEWQDKLSRLRGAICEAMKMEDAPRIRFGLWVPSFQVALEQAHALAEMPGFSYNAKQYRVEHESGGTVHLFQFDDPTKWRSYQVNAAAIIDYGMLADTDIMQALCRVRPQLHPNLIVSRGIRGQFTQL